MIAVAQALMGLLSIVVWGRVYVEVKQSFETQTIRILCMGKSYDRRSPRQSFFGFVDAFVLNSIVLYTAPVFLMGFALHKVHLL